MELTELFIPYKQALALKELGFDEQCLAFFSKNVDNRLVLGEKGYFVTRYYRENVMEYILINSNLQNRAFSPIKNSITAPTYDQAIEWFETTYNLHIGSTYSTVCGYDSLITKYDIKTTDDIEQVMIKFVGYKETKKEAKIACIDYLIELIKTNPLFNEVKQDEYWYEVYIDYGDDEGTETLESFDTEKEAKHYIRLHLSANPDDNLSYDKWYMDENGNNCRAKQE